jgi:hypothetical protein
MAPPVSLLKRIPTSTAALSETLETLGVLPPNKEVSVEAALADDISWLSPAPLSARARTVPPSTTRLVPERDGLDVGGVRSVLCCTGGSS